MDIFKLSVISLVVCLLSVTLKQYKPEFAVLLSVCFGIIALSYLAPYLIEIIKGFEGVGGRYMEKGLMNFVLKITCIAFFARFTSEICRDFGEGSAASKIELAAKVLILANTLPLINSFISSLEGIMR
jgi:stage III sporulation protein AD